MNSSQTHFILFDVTSTLDPPAWSGNPWRTRCVLVIFNKCPVQMPIYQLRFVLNYKNIPYKTEWVHYPDIRTVFPARNVPPTRTEDPLYTVPAIIAHHPDGSSEAISDSPRIIEYLEQRYPTPSLFAYKKAEQEELIDAITKHVVMTMAFMIIPTTVDILDERDREYFIPTRKHSFGVEVEKMFPEDKRDQIWQGVQEGFDALSRIIDEKGCGGDAWIFGDAPTYADFVLVAQFVWLEKAGPKGAWDKVKKWNGGRWEALYKMAEKYMKVV
jgi:glutathione S-transferase